jgi:hypothetical protein
VWRWQRAECEGAGGAGTGGAGAGGAGAGGAGAGGAGAGGASGACDPPSNTGCTSGQACYFFSGGPLCRVEGNAAAGAACVNQDDCVAGHGCAGPVGGNRRCERACRSDQPGTCPGGTACGIWPNQSLYGVCI